MFTSKRLILSAAAVVVAAALLFGVNLLVCRPNRLVIRNSSGARIDGIHVSISPKDGNSAIERDVSRLEPDNDVVIRHGLNDFSVDLVFSMSEKEYQHSEPYVDLWSGEGWVIDVQHDGSVKSSHTNSPRNAGRNASAAPD